MQTDFTAIGIAAIACFTTITLAFINPNLDSLSIATAGLGAAGGLSIPALQRNSQSNRKDDLP